MTAPLEPEYLAKMLDTKWKQRAACRNVDPALFFKRGKNQAIKELCQQCPVKADCLDYALLTEAYGIWGGLSAAERNAEYPKYIRESMREDYE